MEFVFDVVSDVVANFDGEVRGDGYGGGYVELVAVVTPADHESESNRRSRRCGPGPESRKVQGRGDAAW